MYQHYRICQLKHPDSATSTCQECNSIAKALRIQAARRLLKAAAKERR